MIEDKLKPNLQFSEEFNTFLDGHFEDMFNEALISPDVDFEDDEDILDLEQGDDVVNIIVNDKKIRNKIASAILDDRIQNRLITIEYDISKNTIVGGYS
jgi:hypothetical protein